LFYLGFFGILQSFNAVGASPMTYTYAQPIGLLRGDALREAILVLAIAIIAAPLAIIALGA